MRCRRCGQTILSEQAKRADGLCKSCRKAGLPVPPDRSVLPPTEEVVMAEGTVQQPSAPALPSLPEGFRYAYNRMKTEYEMFFDGRPITFKPHETKRLRTDQAEYLRAHSIIPGTLADTGRGTLKGERAIALGPGWFVRAWIKTEEVNSMGNNQYVPEHAEAEAEPDFQVPTETVPGPTLFDLNSTGNYVGRPSQGNMPTHAALVSV